MKMKRLMLYVRYFFLQYRLWSYKQFFSLEADEVTPKNLLAFSMINDGVLLSHSSPYVLKTVEITTAFNNAEELLDWLTLLADTVRNEGFILGDSELIYVLRNQFNLRFSDFLVFKNNRVMTPKFFYERLVEGLIDLNDCIDFAGDDRYKKYITKKVNVLMRELITAEEGLLIAAMNYE